MEVDGVGESHRLDLKLVEAAARRLAKGAVAQAPGAGLLDRGASTIAAPRWPSATSEQFRILFLDKRNGLIADEVQQTGTVDHTPVYPREVIKRALELSASAIILVHNHPSRRPDALRTPTSA